MDLDEWQRWWKTEGRDALNGILLRDWSPIGEWARADEYASYAGQLGRMIRERAQPDEIAARLAANRTESMGLPPSPETDAEVAAFLVAWYERETGD